MVNAFVGDSTS